MEKPSKMTNLGPSGPSRFFREKRLDIRTPRTYVPAHVDSFLGVGTLYSNLNNIVHTPAEIGRVPGSFRNSATGSFRQANPGFPAVCLSAMCGGLEPLDPETGDSVFA